MKPLGGLLDAQVLDPGRERTPVLVADKERDGTEHLDTAEADVAQGAGVELGGKRAGRQGAHRRVDEFGAAEGYCARDHDGRLPSEGAIGAPVEDRGAGHVDVDRDPLARPADVVRLQLGHDRRAGEAERGVAARAGRLDELDRARRSGTSPRCGAAPCARVRCSGRRPSRTGWPSAAPSRLRPGASGTRSVAQPDGAVGAIQANERAGKKAHPGRAEEAGDEGRRRALEEVERRALLLDQPVAHQHDPVGERHRLDLVVGDVDHRRGDLLVQPLDLAAHLVAELGVEVGERLVEQEDARAAHDGAADGDALALAAGELARDSGRGAG